ncbi:hypothetical protein CC86DRAFT_42732 [Ophiobolus disseminans]|uniref:T6SS Phospholipase effector Tle1-like catalytic domain-containing protein n=1 Tax=Ophiobolus disseminans TaxID=1469910 RepID=A0A6A6ZWF8_9PLEO|nr:hypothetical protein CC86DRAFT_42732 [Ophiobolus disseminans]
MASAHPPKRLAVFCDGTWVGRETTVANAPASNIRQLANMVGKVDYNDASVTESTVHPMIVHPHVLSHASHPSTSSSRDSVVAGYQEGVGLNRTFLEYIWDGATASAIGDECISVYRFIVENFTSEHEIWLFGFSRGSFTVRCVAGMINNCGIIKRLPEYSDEDLQRLCLDVFRTYRSTLPQDKPHSDECEHLKGNAERVWQVRRPIRFMGLIDTVGALGIPRLNAGIGFDWAPFEFFDQNASSVVQHIYHAPALHDRLWIFQPCLIYAGDEDGKDKPIVKQRWFPGTHYDVGRMTFRFVRQSPANWVEGALGAVPDLLSRTIFPNEVLSDCVLRWLLEGIQDVGSDTLIPDVNDRIAFLDARIAAPAPNSTGSGDIYGDVLNYAPGGYILGTVQRVSRFVTSSLNRVLPRLGDNIQAFLGIKTIVGILTATTDRRIPGTAADVYPYTQKQVVTINGAAEHVVVAHKAAMQGTNEWGKERYVSRTYENFVLWGKVFGRSGAERNGH